MNYGDPKLIKVKLIGITDRAKKIIKYYKNSLYLMEYDEYGRPMFITPNGLQGIYCVSPDGFWQGWFLLDSEVIFEQENKYRNDILKELMENFNKENAEIMNGRKS